MATVPQIYTLVKSALDTGLAALSISGVTVKQAYQPNQQGMPSGPTIFMNLLPAHRFGWRGASDVWNPDEEVMEHTEIQPYEQTMRISTFVRQDPENEAQLLAPDLANFAAYILQSEATLAFLRENGIGVQRITNIFPSYFYDDKDRFETGPSFEVVLTHKQIVQTEIPVLQSTEIDIYSV